MNWRIKGLKRATCQLRNSNSYCGGASTSSPLGKMARITTDDTMRMQVYAVHLYSAPKTFCLETVFVKSEGW